MTTEDRVYRLIKLLLYVAEEEKVEVTATKLQKIFFLLSKDSLGYYLFFKIHADNS